MATKIVIESDGTREGTRFLVNGVDVTREMFITDVYFHASDNVYVSWTELEELEGNVKKSTSYRLENDALALQPAEISSEPKRVGGVDNVQDSNVSAKIFGVVTKLADVIEIPEKLEDK